MAARSQEMSGEDPGRQRVYCLALTLCPVTSVTDDAGNDAGDLQHHLNHSGGDIIKEHRGNIIGTISQGTHHKSLSSYQHGHGHYNGNRLPLLCLQTVTTIREHTAEYGINSV